MHKEAARLSCLSKEHAILLSDDGEVILEVGVNMLEAAFPSSDPS